MWQDCMHYQIWNIEKCNTKWSLLYIENEGNNHEIVQRLFSRLDWILISHNILPKLNLSIHFPFPLNSNSISSQTLVMFYPCRIFSSKPWHQMNQLAYLQKYNIIEALAMIMIFWIAFAEWLTDERRWPYFQPGQLSEDLIVPNFERIVIRIWTSDQDLNLLKEIVQ